MRILILGVLIAGLLSVSSAAADTPVLEVDPVEVEPGADLFFLVSFPESAEGTAVLEFGDGRTQEIPTAVGEVEIVERAPEAAGEYVAVLTVTVDGDEQTHMAAYKVVGGEDDGTPDGEDRRGAAAPLAAAVVALLGVLLLRRRFL